MSQKPPKAIWFIAGIAIAIVVVTWFLTITKVVSGSADQIKEEIKGFSSSFTNSYSKQIKPNFKNSIESIKEYAKEKGATK